MKKSIMAAFAAIFLGAACVGFAACGTAGGTEKDAAKDIVGIEVTEEEWKVALEYFEKDGAEFSVQLLAEESGQFDGPGTYNGRHFTMTITDSCRAKGGKSYCKVKVESSGNEATPNIDEELYGVSEDGTDYIIRKNEDGKWNKDFGHLDLLHEIDPNTRLDNPVDNFSDFHYDEQQKGYLREESSPYEEVFKFGKVGNDIRLIAVYRFLNEEEEYYWHKYEASFVFSYTNVADITLPDVG